MSERLPPQHLLVLLDTLEGFRHEHARVIVAFAQDVLETSQRYPRGERGARTAPDAAAYRIGKEDATKRVRAAREALGRQRTVVMRLCGIEGRSFADAALDLGRGPDDIEREFLFACGDLLRCYRAFEEPREMIVRFAAEERHFLPNGGEVHSGPAPCGMDRENPSIAGQIVSIGSDLYRCLGVERRPTKAPIRAGENIALLVKPLG